MIKITNQGKRDWYLTFLYYWPFTRTTVPVRGSAMKTIHGKPRRAYRLTRDDF